MKTVLMMVASANGYIARPNHETPWSTEAFARCDEYARAAGNLIVGRRTYGDMLKEGSIDDKILTVVVTRDISEPHDNTVYLSSPCKALEYVKDKGYELANVGGGAITAMEFLSEKLIDEIILDIEPILLEDGISLAKDIPADIQLRLLSALPLDAAVRLTYEVQK